MQNINQIDDIFLNNLAKKYGLKSHTHTDNYIFSIGQSLLSASDFIISNKLSLINMMNTLNHNRRTDGKAVTIYPNPDFFEKDTHSSRVKDILTKELDDIYNLYNRTYPSIESLTNLFKKNNSIRYSDNIIGIDGIISDLKSKNIETINRIDQMRKIGLKKCSDLYHTDTFYNKAYLLEQDDEMIWGPKRINPQNKDIIELSDSDFDSRISAHLKAKKLFDPDINTEELKIFEEKICGKFFRQGEAVLKTVRLNDSNRSSQYVFGHLPDLEKYYSNPYYFTCMQMKLPHLGLKSCDRFVEWTPHLNLYYALKSFYSKSQDFVRFVLPNSKFFPRRKDKAKEDKILFNEYPIAIMTIDFTDDRTENRIHPKSTLFYFLFYNLTPYADYYMTYDWPGHEYNPTRMKIYDVFKRPVQQKLIFYGNSITYTEFNNFVTYFKPKIYRHLKFKNIIFIKTEFADEKNLLDLPLERVYYDTLIGKHFKHYLGLWANKKDIDTLYLNEKYIYANISGLKYFVSVSPIATYDHYYLGLRIYNKNRMNNFTQKGGGLDSIKLTIGHNFNTDYMGSDPIIAGDYFIRYTDLTTKIWKKIMPKFEKFNILATIMYPLLYVVPREFPITYIDNNYIKTYDRFFKYVTVQGSNITSITKNPNNILSITEYQPRTNRFFRHHEVLFNKNILMENADILLLTDGEVDFSEAAVYYASNNNIQIKSHDILFDISSSCAKIKKTEISFIKQFSGFTDINVLNFLTPNQIKYDLVVEQTRCRNPSIDWFYEYFAFPTQLKFITYALQHLNPNANLVYNVKSLTLKIQADIILILKEIFDKIELYNLESVPQFKESSVICICYGFNPKTNISELISRLNDIYQQISTIDFEFEYTPEQKELFLVGNIPNSKGRYYESILDIESDNESYDFIREFNTKIHIDKYAYIKEVEKMMSYDADMLNSKLEDLMDVNYTKSKIYAKKYNFRLRILGSDLTNDNFGIRIMSDMYFKHYPINFLFDKKESSDMIGIPTKFREFEGMITSAHMIIDTRNISEWFNKKSKIRYYRPGSKGISEKNLKEIDLTKMIETSYGTGRISQAWLKMYEIISIFGSGLVDLSKKTIKTFHLCEAPGNFIAAINHYVKTSGQGQIEFDWIAQSLNKHVVGAGFGDDYGYISKYKNRWDFGKDNTGDITKKKNIIYYSGLVSKSDFVTSDCGISRDEEGAVGSSMLKIHFAELVIILKGLSKGKGFVAKYFMPIFRPIEFSILYTLFCSFGKMSFYKPLINIFSLEFYIVCEDYLGVDLEVINQLEKMLHEETFDYNKHIYKSYPREFMEQLLAVSFEIINNYLFNFRRQIYYVDNLHLLSDTQIKHVEYYIRKKNIEWIKSTGIQSIKGSDKL